MADDHKRPNRRDFLKVSGAAGIALTAGCLTGDSGGSGGTSNGKPTVSTLGTEVGAAGLLTKIMEDHVVGSEDIPINLEVTYAGTEQEEGLFAQGEVDTAPLSMPRAADLYNQGQEIKLIRPQYRFHCQTVYRSEVGPIESLQDLQGLTIGTLPAGSSIYNTMEVMLSLEGIDINSLDLRPGGPSAYFSLLQQGELDAAWFFYPFTARLLATGDFETALDYSETWVERTGHQLAIGEMAVHQDYWENNREAAIGFVEAVNKAGEYVKNNAHQIFHEEYIDHLGLEGNPEAQDITQDYMSEIYPAIFPDDMRMGDREMMKAAAEAGVVDSAPVDEVFVPPGEMGF